MSKSTGLHRNARMRPPTVSASAPTTTSSYTMIPLRAPFPGAPPRYVAVATSKNPASMTRAEAEAEADVDQPHKKNPASIAIKEAVDTPSFQAPKAAPTPEDTPTATKLKPNPTRIPLSRAQSAPLQEMREATVAVRDNSRLGDRDATGADRRDAVELHPLKFWEM